MRKTKAVNNLVSTLDMVGAGGEAVLDGVELANDIADAAETGGGVLSGISDCFDEDFLPIVIIGGTILAVAGIVMGIVKLVKKIKK